MWSTALRELLLAGTVLVALGCSSGPVDDPRVVATTFAPIDPVTDVLTAADVDLIVQAAAESNDAQNLAIAVTDRIGNILRVWNRNPATHPGFDCENNIATSIARAAAYLSHSQAPLTSRTGQFLSTFHFPPVFDVATYDPMLGLDCAPVRPTLGVANTPQGPLWQIDASNRGTPIESAATNPPTAFDPGKAIPVLANPDSSVPSPGLTALPGGVPLYKQTTASGFDVGRRLVGAVGVYSTDGSGDPQPELAEFAALTGALQVDLNTGQPYLFQPMIPFEGAVFLVGILLPYIEQTARPPSFGPGTYDVAQTVVNTGAGAVDPSGWLISPRASLSGTTFTAAEVDAVITACVDASLLTHAAIRLPATSACRMIIAITDVDGVILGAFRMEDATLFSLEISITKARNAVYYSNPTSVDFTGPNAGQHPLTGIVPPGTAFTARSLGFLSQPMFPPTIEGQPPGPLCPLALRNRMTDGFTRMGFAPTAAEDISVQPDTQSGIIFFPGSAPLYRDGILIGGIGVSGDGVEQDDLVTAQGIRAAQQALGFDLEPPPGIRSDQYRFRGVAIPYWKFPQNPNG